MSAINPGQKLWSRNAGSSSGAWCAYLIDSLLPNGCFVTAASCELDGQPGELRDRLYDAVTRWRRFLAEQMTTAQAAGDLAPDLDPEELVSTLTGLAMAANQEIQIPSATDASTPARPPALPAASMLRRLDGNRLTQWLADADASQVKELGASRSVRPTRGGGAEMTSRVAGQRAASGGVGMRWHIGSASWLMSPGVPPGRPPGRLPHGPGRPCRRSPGPVLSGASLSRDRARRCDGGRAMRRARQACAIEVDSRRKSGDYATVTFGRALRHRLGALRPRPGGAGARAGSCARP